MTDLPPAYDGCNCLCHRQEGVYHFIACCGAGHFRIDNSLKENALTPQTDQGDGGGDNG